MLSSETGWQGEWELIRMYNPNSGAVHPDHLKRLHAVEAGVALRIADDMDFWNSIHDADNQADADWIRQRYANNRNESDG